MNELEGRLGDDLGQGETMIAWSVVFAHVIAGASLVLGFVTRVAAGANALILFGAMIMSIVATPTATSLLTTNIDFQFTTLIFVVLVLFIWRGAGPLSLDHLIRLDAEREPEVVL